MKQDKVYHLIVGIILGFINLYLGIGAGIAKEIYDYFSPKHTADTMDILATVIGAFIGYAIRSIL